MGQLKKTHFATCEAAMSVCLDDASSMGWSDDSSCLIGETLAQRASRLDFALERSRSDLGAVGEPGHIEISGSDRDAGRRERSCEHSDQRSD